MKISNLLGFSKQGAHGSAHEVHFKTIAYKDNGQAQHVIFKKNKHPGQLGQQASELEASFTAIANGFGAPHRALQQDLVSNRQGEIVGVGSEHAAQALLRMRNMSEAPAFMQANHKFSSADEVDAATFKTWVNSHTVVPAQKPLVPVGNKAAYTERLDNYQAERELLGEEVATSEWSNLRKKCEAEPQRTENIHQEMNVATLDAGKGFNFLDKLPQNFFAKLLEQKQQGLVDVDMDSLADVFTTAYGLEEDDLHKGNIGYYVTQGAERPQFHFFKIDHDLMFSDKVMAARDQRLANVSYSSNKFRINADDLRDFPDLQHSGNHYWPTKSAIFAKGDKAYQSKADREAYKSLKHDPDFKDAKWLRFLKQAVMPNDFIVKCLEQPLATANTNPDVKNTLAMVQRATASRVAELRTALINVPEFRDYISHNSDVASKLIIAEVSQHAQTLGCSKQDIAAYSFAIGNAIKAVVMASVISTEKTALHAAVNTQSYRCHESASYFKKSLNNRDEQGLTALDHAISQHAICIAAMDPKVNKDFSIEKRVYYKKMQVYYSDVICDLDARGAKYTTKDAQPYQEVLERARQRNSLSLLPVVTSLADFKSRLEACRSTPMQTLKQDKVCALHLLNKAQLSKEDLLQLKTELEPKEPSGALKFIKELRSEIWIVKQIKGAYGSTSTYSDMCRCIDRKLEVVNRKEKAQESYDAAEGGERSRLR